jgi:hypothetical protein
MDWRLVAAVIVGITLVVVLKELSRKTVPTGRYRIRGPLLTKAERSFFGVLGQAVGDTYTVFAKVRVADVLAPEKGTPKKEWRSAFNRISAKHFDFVFCDPGSLSVECVLELNDKSHARSNRAKRDAFVREACDGAGLRLIEVDAKAAYSIQDLRALLMATVPANNAPSLTPRLRSQPNSSRWADRIMIGCY